MFVLKKDSVGTHLNYYPFGDLEEEINTTGVKLTYGVYLDGQVEVKEIVGGDLSGVFFYHSDHLGSSSVVTDGGGKVVQSVDYYPFGGIRHEYVDSTFENDYLYTGKEFDEELGVYYYGARYYNADIGRFMGIDPAVLDIGVIGFKNKYGQELRELLLDPQGLNVYAYGINNPFKYIDPTGQRGVNIFAVLPESTQIAIGNWANNLSSNNAVARYAMDHPYQTGAAMGVLGGALVAGGIVLGGGSITCGIFCGSVATTIGAGGTAISTQGNTIDDAIQQGVKLLNGPIKITADRLEHVMQRHTVEGLESAGNSLFNKGENIVQLIQQGASQVAQKQSSGINYQRVFDVGRNIGIDRVTNQATSIMTIITNSAGKLITAFPGIPNY